MSPSRKLLTLQIMAAAALLSVASPSTARTTQGFFSDDINVKITNTLEGQLSLGVHCKDKNHDLGSHQLAPGDMYEFKARSTMFHRADYFCGFVFENKLHWFDIYLDKRDLGRCSTDSCNWFIKKDGPCYGDPYALDNCYPWNQD